MTDAPTEGKTMALRLNDKVHLETLRKQITDTLTKVGEQHGITLKAEACKFDGDGTSCTFKLEVAQAGLAEKWERDAAEKFTGYAEVGLIDGLKPEDLGKTFEHNGHEWTLIGYKPRSQKTPMLLRRTDNGRAYKFSAKLVADKIAALK